jgi:hypothetical protein
MIETLNSQLREKETENNEMKSRLDDLSSDLDASRLELSQTRAQLNVLEGEEFGTSNFKFLKHF